MAPVCDKIVLGIITLKRAREVCANLTDVTLADDDTKSKITDNAKRAIQANEAMQVK